MGPKVVERILRDDLQQMGARKDAKVKLNHKALDIALLETRKLGLSRSLE